MEGTAGLLPYNPNVGSATAYAPTTIACKWDLPAPPHHGRSRTIQCAFQRVFLSGDETSFSHPPWGERSKGGQIMRGGTPFLISVLVNS